MRCRRLLAAAILLVASACSEPAPTEPLTLDPSAPSNTFGPPGCPSPLQIRIDLTRLFVQPGQALLANLKFTAVELAVIQKKTSLAQERMFRLLQFLLTRYEKGDLRGGQSDQTQVQLTAVIKELYCFVGLPEPNLSGVLGPDGAAAVILPDTPDTTVVTDTKFAGAEIPSGTVQVPTLFTITRLPDSPGPLRTPLDQYPAFYEFNATPAVPLTQDVIVGTCQAKDFAELDYGRLKIGHNVAEGIELLPRVDAPFLDCRDLISARNVGPGWFQYASRGWGAVGPFVSALLLPSKVNASVMTLATCCLGGSTKTFSPFGAVDTLVNIAAASPTSITGPALSVVPAAQLPAVTLLTPAGQPVPGISVTFSVPAGSQGSLTGAVQVTGPDGVARVGGWTLGSGGQPSTVTAVAAPLQAGTGVAGNPVSFTATVTPLTVIPYGATGYRYFLVGSSGPPNGYESPTFNDAAWLVGVAAFGTGANSPVSCPLNSTTHTFWPAAPVVSTPQKPTKATEILLRHTFQVPSGWTGSLSLRAAVDNDIKVFVNGVNITASAGSATMVGIFQIHEGCATQGSFVFTAPNSVLVRGGQNLIAVRARDRGKTSYVDVEVRLDP